MYAVNNSHLFLQENIVDRVEHTGLRAKEINDMTAFRIGMGLVVAETSAWWKADRSVV